MNEAPAGQRTILPLGIAALGVVFGDIGTSPLYAMRQCFTGVNSVSATSSNILGVLSLVFWALIIVISLKYLLFVMRQDNHGEGGIIALVALLGPLAKRHAGVRVWLIPLGLFGAALLYGDGTITPAISVLSAMEGLSADNPTWQPWIIPLTVAILSALFYVQHKGTQRLGSIFGPVMLLWFVTLAALGVRGIAIHPAVIEAVNPLHALNFFQVNGFAGFLVLGTVFLVVTGGEALYADMGHFGLTPIRLSWFTVVLPALLLNYFGQGALILAQPSEAAHPFFDLAPAEYRIPLVVLATLATIIASQAVISGAFSLTAQAIRLDFLPRMRVVHTSAAERGQVYIPLVNWLLMAATIGLVLGFRSSDKLGAAYGLAVAADMTITTLLAGVLAWRYASDRRAAKLAVGLVVCLWVVDWAFLSANLFKFLDGGWYPLIVGIAIFTIMSTWRRGRQLLTQRFATGRESLQDFLASRAKQYAYRIPGTAVFLTAQSAEPPPILLHHLSHHHLLHERIILLTVRTSDVPRVPAADRIRLEELSKDCFRLELCYGYFQSPNVPIALRLCEHLGLSIDPDAVTYYLGRETLIPSDDDTGISVWRERLFAFLTNNAQRAPVFYGMPTERVVELGIQIEL